jgi:hypothetical protein
MAQVTNQNAIQTQSEIDLYIDRARNQRYPRLSYDIAVNNAVRLFIEERAGDKKNPNGLLSYKSEQQVSDELYTLQSTLVAAPTADVAAYPSDYYFLISIYINVGGKRVRVLPTNENRIGPQQRSNFFNYTDDFPYFIQVSGGFQILHGTGTISTVEINYLCQASYFTIGNEGQLINPGATLTVGSTYIATQQSVVLGVSYNVGDVFTSGTTTLTSGQCILQSQTTPLNLPVKTQNEIAKRAAEILTGVSQEYNRAMFNKSQADKS